MGALSTAEMKILSRKPFGDPEAEILIASLCEHLNLEEWAVRAMWHRCPKDAREEKKKAIREILADIQSEKIKIVEG